MSLLTSFGWNMCAQRSRTVLLSISPFSLSEWGTFEYHSTNSEILSKKFCSSQMSLNWSFERYERQISKCIKTEVGTCSQIKLIMMSKSFWTSSLFCYKYSFVSFACKMLASKALLKSNENTWISFFKDLLIKLTIQSIMPLLTMWITVSSFIEIF